MSSKLHTCPVTPQEMGKVWRFTRATLITVDKRANILAKSLPEYQELVNVSVAHKCIPVLAGS